MGCTIWKKPRVILIVDITETFPYNVPIPMNRQAKQQRNDYIIRQYEVLVEKQGKKIPAQIRFLADLHDLTQRHIRNILKGAL